MRRIWACFAVVGFIIALTSPNGPAFAQTGLQPLASQFWQWALSIPAADNPVTDTTGDKCMIGQQGPIWFLAGTFGSPTGETTIRSCSVPAGVAVFFPVINSFFINMPNCLQGPENLTVEFMRSQLAPSVDQAYNVSVTLDGRRVIPVRVRSTPFPIAIPGENVFGPDACGAGVPLAAGIYSPSVADGLFVMLEKLPAMTQPYEIHFHAESVFFGTPLTQDVIIHLTVVPAPSK